MKSLWGKIEKICAFFKFFTNVFWFSLILYLNSRSLIFFILSSFSTSFRIYLIHIISVFIFVLRSFDFNFVSFFHYIPSLLLFKFHINHESTSSVNWPSRSIHFHLRHTLNLEFHFIFSLRFINILSEQVQALLFLFQFRFSARSLSSSICKTFQFHFNLSINRDTFITSIIFVT